MRKNRKTQDRFFLYKIVENTYTFSYFVSEFFWKNTTELSLGIKFLLRAYLSAKFD